MRNLKTQGIILKRRNVNEADRLLTIYTKDLGKILVKAQGVRRITSRRASHIEQLNFSEISLYKGSSMYTLVEAQVINSFAEIKNDLEKMGLAYHIIELIDGLCPEGQEHDKLFSLLKNTLNELALSSKDEFLFIAHNFEIELLIELGFWHKKPEASQDLDTQNFIEGILERKLKSHRIFSKLS